jgi:hypothetical protein
MVCGVLVWVVHSQPFRCLAWGCPKVLLGVVGFPSLGVNCLIGGWKEYHGWNSILELHGRWEQTSSGVSCGAVPETKTEDKVDDTCA